MSSFVLPETSPPCRVELPDNITSNQLLEFRPFNTWLSKFKRSLSQQESSQHTFHKHPYSLHGIKVQTVDFFGGGRIGFVKISADVRNQKDEKLPASMLLRGGSVAMLVRLWPHHKQDPLTWHSYCSSPMTRQSLLPKSTPSSPSSPASQQGVWGLPKSQLECSTTVTLYLEQQQRR